MVAFCLFGLMHYSSRLCGATQNCESQYQETLLSVRPWSLARTCPRVFNTYLTAPRMCMTWSFMNTATLGFLVSTAFSRVVEGSMQRHLIFSGWYKREIRVHGMPALSNPRNIFKAKGADSLSRAGIINGKEQRCPFTVILFKIVIWHTSCLQPKTC